MKKEGYERLGWAAFLAGCIFFLIESVESGNVLACWGSIFFTMGCLSFLKPIYFPEE
jgi:hypothetical protein